MFNFKLLYKQLGNLFYAVAYADGKIDPHEKEVLTELVQFNWKHMENSADEFHTDAANFILFQFDYNEANLQNAEHAFRAFTAYVEAYGDNLNDYLKEKIFHSARRIAESVRRLNNEEVKMLVTLREVLHMQHPHNHSNYII